MSQGHSQNVHDWVKLLLKKSYDYCNLEWFRGCRICVLPLASDFLFLFFPWSCFPVKPASKTEVTLAAVGISRDELQQGKPAAEWSVCQWGTKGAQFSNITHLTQQLGLPCLVLYTFGYPHIHFNRQKISLKENVCHYPSPRFTSTCFTGWSIQSAAAEMSAPAACPCSTPTPDTLCFKQSALKPLQGSSSQLCSSSGWPGYQ